MGEMTPDQLLRVVVSESVQECVWGGCLVKWGGYSAGQCGSSRWQVSDHAQLSLNKRENPDMRT